VLCLPGLPAELDAVLEAAQPLLDELLPRRHRATREIETPTADESTLGPLLTRLRSEHPRVRATTLAGGYRDRGARVRVLLETSGSDRNECESRIETAMRRLLALAAGVR
jgi:molybdopterin-biosynthesis enzyme MoeA-like protein